MATSMRHAAWWNERSFAVGRPDGQGPPAELAGGFSEFLDAFDFAVEWLEREDPGRAGTTHLAIFETHAGTTEQVWTYPPERPAEGKQLVNLFGFDPTTWKSTVPEFASDEPKGPTFLNRAAQARGQAKVIPIRPGLATAPAAVERGTPARTRTRRPTVPQERNVAAVRSGGSAGAETDSSVQIGARFRAAWEDAVSRACLSLGVVSILLWLIVAQSFLVLLPIALAGLWWRRDKRADAAKADAEDCL